ncbi:MAG TPA: MraY family glycosyltransferase [bacterium]|nr:MraY family glycosyltransferase [bacterium]
MALQSLGLAGILALALGRLCMAWALRMRWVDRPGHRKIHSRPVPYLGGVALFAALGLTVLSLLLLPQTGVPGLAGFSLPCLLVCVAPALLAMALGLWDDLYGLRARYKFVGQGLLALLFSQFAYRFMAIHIPGFPPLVMEPEIAVLVTAFFIVAIVNGFNMMDGSDALCLGASLVTFAMVAVVAQVQGQPHLVFMGLAAAGACLGLLFWNRPPARIYLGDAGSQGLGFLAVCMVVALGKHEPGQFVVGLVNDPSKPKVMYKVVVALLLVAWPACEVLLTVLRRGLQGRGLGQADQGHIHHRLGRLGLGPWAIALCAVLLNLYCGLVVMAFLAAQKGLAVLLMLPLAALLSLGIQKLGYMRFLKRSWLEDRRPHYAIATHFAAMQAAKLKVARNHDEVLALVEETCHEFGVHACRVSVRDDTKKQSVWTWSDKAAPAPPRVTWERIRIAGTRNRASWSADAHDEREPELSMNLRVLMADFMRLALERLGELSGNVISFAEMRGQASGERKRLMSIKGLKQRLHKP